MANDFSSVPESALARLGHQLYQRALVRRDQEPITDPRGQPIGWLLDTRMPMLINIVAYWVIAFPLAVLAVAGIGVLYHEGPIRRSKSRNVLTLVLITVGASIVMKGGAMLIWGKSAQILPPWGSETPIVFLNAAIMPQTLWIIGLTLTVVVALYIFYQRTLLGKAMRAVADNPEGAVLIGISARKLVALAFALSGALGAMAGILITPLTSMSYGSGLMMCLKGFAAAILGGFGSTVGAVAGGLLLGILESFGAGFISSTYKDAIAFVLFLVILFARPAGLFGSARVRRL